MKRLAVLIVTMLLAPAEIFAASQSVVVVEIKDMSCPVCAQTISKQLQASVPGVEKAEVSLRKKQATVILAPGREPDVARIKQVITDAGFEAGNANVRTVDKKP